MKPTTPTPEKRTARETIRPRYFDLGRDTRGCWHVADTTRAVDVVQVIHPDGTRELFRVDADQSLDDWMRAVADAYGWDRRLYGQDIVTIAAESLR